MPTMLLLLLAALSLAAPRPAASSPCSYDVVDLGTLGGDTSLVAAIDGAGRAVGRSRGPGPTDLRAFLWVDGTMTDLGTLGGAYSAAEALNDRGQVVGWSDTPDGGAHAVLWEAGTMSDLGTLGGALSVANGINAAGDVVGYSELAGGHEVQGFLHRDGVTMPVGPPGFTASAIDGRGRIAGTMVVGAHVHAALIDGEDVIDLGTLGGEPSFGKAFDARGRVLGDSYTGSFGPVRAFAWLDGVIVDLGALESGPQAYTQVYGAGPHGEILGVSAGRAFLLDDDGMHDLSALAPPGVVLVEGQGVDARGRVAANRALPSSRFRAVLLVPADGAIATARLRLHGLDTPPGDDRLDLRGGAPFGAIDPAADGVRVLVTGATGRAIVDETVAPGAGWTVSHGGTAWSWDAAGESGGIRRVRLRVRRGGTRFQVAGRDGDWAASPDDLPLAVTLVVGGRETGPAACRARAFDAASRGRCRFDRRGRALHCR
jgi:probable HAF family extracellular repeat protein